MESGFEIAHGLELSSKPFENQAGFAYTPHASPRALMNPPETLHIQQQLRVFWASGLVWAILVFNLRYFGFRVCYFGAVWGKKALTTCAEPELQPEPISKR